MPENSLVTKHPGAAGRLCYASILPERLQINAELATSLEAEEADLAEAEKSLASMEAPQQQA